ncbi:TRZ/ATZ family hydrolase [Alkalilimnicola ehrlichii]|uniref:5-methylthioadenosine/S-adenosylhomocysteine deaminase n=1 Tax=Alkalilimnicola ehrlichii TaxID=351052 RepID=A0A3E0WY48_9GAMM|nr:TRZ/ATZ family hydrolase [Alkalilimnicola ehrlichii]RFA36915.1 N-ethylammeline chlorohydrolase [Alkalilimnicola ehrlichii]
MESIDAIIHARWIVPVEPADTVLENHSLLIRDGRILALLPRNEAESAYEAKVVHELSHHVLIPGLVNAHSHAAMSLLRGLADDLPLMTWLNEHIWPAEQRHVSAEFVHDGAELAIAEMLLGGITCFNDMYFFPEMTAKAATQAGIRVSLGMILIDFPSSYAQSPAEYFDKGLSLHDHYRHHPLVSTVFAPHSPYTVSEKNLERVGALAAELEAPIHIHLHETAEEVAQAVASEGERPFAKLDRLGLISPELIAVHLTQLETAEIERMADVGAHAVHCPESNLKLASGFCPVHELMQAGINVALGTDGAASNNDLDLFGEMRTAALLAKAVAGDAAALPAHAALRMATLNGARALGLSDVIGSLEAGKFADITAISLDDLHSEPMYNPLSQLVYASNRNQISDVWVAGRHLVRERELTTISRGEVIAKARRWRDKIAAS